MEPIQYKHNRWNTIGFIIFTAYLCIILGLIYIIHQYDIVNSTVHYIFWGASIVLAINLVVYFIITIRKGALNKSKITE